MKLRSMFLTMLVLFSLVLGSAYAQDMPLGDCLNLDQADCDVITEATANGIGDATSFTIELEIAFEVSGIPGGEEAGSASFDMSGVIDVAEGNGMLIPFNMAGVFDVAATQDGAAILPPMTLESAIIDDFLYFSDPFSGEWAGIDILTLMSSDEFNEILAPLLEGDTSALGVDAPDIESLLPLLGILELPGFLDYSRDGDDFILTVDFAALQSLSDPENSALLTALDNVLTESDPSLEGMAAVLPMLISEGTIEFVQTVNADLNIVDNFQFNTFLEVVLGADPLVIDMTINMAVTNLDEAPEPTAPEQFEDITDDALGGF
jgi:hypothetical protein